MTEVRNLHSADGSFLGFLFQIERVLIWLSNAETEGMIGVEVDDDIVVQLRKGNKIETIYEQAKNSQQKNKTPFTDKSEDLWKTLSIWVKLVTEKGVDPEKACFSAISNRKIPKSRLLQDLSNASKKDSEQLKGICVRLKKYAGELRAGLKKYGKVVQQCDDLVLASIINNIIVFDSEYSHETNFKKVLKKNLRMSEDLPFDYIYNALFGYVTNVLIESWKKGEEGWISVNAFLIRYTSLIAEYKNKKFIEKATASLPVSTQEIANNRNKVYVEQLKVIGCDDEEILENIEHYLRASSEKSRYAKEGDVSEEIFSRYYQDLIENWKSVARPKFKASKTQPNKYESVGYDVFYESIRYKGKLNNQEPEQAYTHKGAYHFLSNNVQLGWHPEWEKKFKKKDV